MMKAPDGGCVDGSVYMHSHAGIGRASLGGNVVNDVEKKQLSQEARMQINALRQIGWWKTIALAVSAAGVALVYAGSKGSIFLGISGAILMILGAGSAAVFNLGLKNGKRNVEKMLNLLDREGSYEL